MLSGKYINKTVVDKLLHLYISWSFPIRKTSKHLSGVVEVVGLSPIRKDLRDLKRNLIQRMGVPTADLMLMSEFVLKDNFFEYGLDVKQRVLCSAIGKKI